MNRKERRALARKAAGGTAPDAARIASLFAEALDHHQAGKLAEAERGYEGVIALAPTHADALHNLGLVALQTGRIERAVELICRAIAVESSDPAFHCNLGTALGALGRAGEAADSYRRALALAPDQADALNGLGNALREIGKDEEATTFYRRAVQARPDFAEAWNNLGNLLYDGRKLEEALAAYDRAARDPALADAHYNRGNVLLDLGRLAEAAQSYERALALRPRSARLHNNYGNALLMQGKFDAAIAAYRTAIALDPGPGRPHGNLAAALNAKGDLEEAAASYARALAIDPGYVEAHHNLGNLLRRQGKLEEAAASYGRALALQPDHTEAFCELAFVRRMLCDWSSIAADEHRLLDLVRGPAGRVPPFVLLNVRSDPADQLRCAARWMAGLAVPAEARLVPAEPTQRADGKIRIGYLSADFHRHATAYLMAELFERHDRNRFEVFGYSHGPDDHSDIRRRLIAGFDRFLDLRGASHEQAARLIRDDAVDILLDLKGYTQAAKTEILSYRPAPLQVNFLGYPGTMGSDLIDYAIVDRFVVPEEQQPFYSEKLVWLPHCYQPNDTKRKAAAATPTRADCGLPEQGFVFCCFNNGFKLTPDFLDIWARLLAAVPAGVLWLLESNPSARANLQREAAARGIAPERLVFAPRLPLEEHLARHRLADLFLDTLPYNAHTTASDALWMGVPVVTCAGNSFAGRVAGSLLHAVGLPELVTTDVTAYEALALALARNPERLAQLRDRLAGGNAAAPLFDITRYTRNIEQAFCRMWEIRRSGEAPGTFAVADLGAA